MYYNEAFYNIQPEHRDTVANIVRIVNLCALCRYTNHTNRCMKKHSNKMENYIIKSCKLKLYHRKKL